MANDPQPLARSGRVHQFQSFAGSPAVPAGYAQPVSAVYPDQLLGRPARAHEFPFLFKPGKLVSPPAIQPVQPIAPNRLTGRPRRAHEYQYLAKPAQFVTPVAPAIPGVGPAGAATFVLSLEPGAKVVYSWSTSVTTSHAGKEHRESPFGQPRRRFEGNAFLLDDGMRDVSGALMRSAASGATFLLALPFEEASIAEDSISSTVHVTDTAVLDWALPGQRAVVIGRDGTTAGVIVQSTTATTIPIVRVDSAGNFTFGALGDIGLAGGRIMPLVPVLLEPVQGFSRFPVNVGLMTVRAMAVGFGFAGVDSMGVGTEITTITDGEATPVEDLAIDDMLVWDRVNAIEGTATEVMQSRAELVDLGALAFGAGAADTPDWGRSIRMRSSSIDDWQWLKAFVRFARGRQGPFLLSTNRPDLNFVSTVSGGIKVESASVAGGGDYASWFVSGAHRRLAITGGGVVQYVEVSEVVDNLDGTLTLTLGSTISGAVTQISLLEQVRLDSDDVEVTWDGGTFDVALGVVSVQEAVQVRLRFLFDTVIETGTLTVPGLVKELGGTFGEMTLINFASDRSMSVSGIAATGGNVDGMLVCVCNTNGNTSGMQMNHEDVTSTAASRLRNSGLASNGSTGGAVWYRYNGTLLRWVELMSTF